MKCIIAGGRNISPAVVPAIVDECPWHNEITCVISGCATGVDTGGEIWALQNNVEVVEFPVTKRDWDTYGKYAGPRRNAQMAEYAAALILIWDGKSRGSANMLREAQKRGLMIWEYTT